jgi:hypothetical protein
MLFQMRAFPVHGVPGEDNSLFQSLPIKKVKQSLYTPWRRLGAEDV